MADLPEPTRLLWRESAELLWVALGAVPGALLRWQIALHFPDCNIGANVLGAGLLGWLAGLPPAPRRQLFLGIGFCGSLTTFSSWMLDVIRFLAAGLWSDAFGLIGFTLGFGFGAAWLGFWLAQRRDP